MILQHKLKNRVTVNKDFQTIPNIFCAAGKINQVFMNILNNSADSIENQGIINICGYQKNNNIILEFNDNGKGIPSDILDRIFEPFFTTKPVGSGTGLGLSISYSIISEHKGSISIDSKPGNTTFKIVLPIIKE